MQFSKCIPTLAVVSLLALPVLSASSPDKPSLEPDATTAPDRAPHLFRSSILARRGPGEPSAKKAPQVSAHKRPGKLEITQCKMKPNQGVRRRSDASEPGSSGPERETEPGEAWKLVNAGEWKSGSLLESLVARQLTQQAIVVAAIGQSHATGNGGDTINKLMAHITPNRSRELMADFVERLFADLPTVNRIYISVGSASDMDALHYLLQLLDQHNGEGNGEVPSLVFERQRGPGNTTPSPNTFRLGAVNDVYSEGLMCDISGIPRPPPREKI